MLDREDLPAISQRALGQEADFRKAVEDHARRLDAFDDVENLTRCFTELQIGRIQQALLLFRIEKAFWRDEFKHIDLGPQRPTMGSGTVTKFRFCLGQGDVETLLAGLRTLDKELQCDRRFPGTGFTLEKE